MNKTRIAFFAALSAVLVSCITPTDEPVERTEDHMSLSPNVITPIIDPNSLIPGNPAANVFEMAAGTPTNKNDIDYNNQKFENKIVTLNDTKVDRAGDTMTGLLTLAPSGTTGALIATAGVGSGQPAITAVGDLNFPALVLVSPSGSGLVSSAKIEVTGNAGQNGADIGPGTAPTALIPQVGTRNNGLIRMTGVAPGADVDPGFDTTISPQSIVTSKGICRSLGGNAFDVRSNAGFNIALFEGTAAGVATVTFTRPLPGNVYAMQIFPPDGYLVGWNGVQNNANFQFVVRSATTNATVDLTTTALAFSVTTVGY